MDRDAIGDGGKVFVTSHTLFLWLQDFNKLTCFSSYTLYTFLHRRCNILCYSVVFVDKMFFDVSRVFFLVFCSVIAITDSQDIVGCGGFIISEVEINFSVIEVCTCWH